MIVRAVGYAGGETCLEEVGSRCGPLDVIAICGSSSCSLLPQAPIAMDRATPPCLPHCEGLKCLCESKQAFHLLSHVCGILLQQKER